MLSPLSPASDSDHPKLELPTVKISYDEPGSSQPVETPKRKRPSTPDGDFNLLTPSKRARTTHTPGTPRNPKTPAQSEAAIAEKFESARKKAEVSATKVANAATRKKKAEEKKAEQTKKKLVAQWKQDWKDWVAANQTEETLESHALGECVNVKNGKAFFDLKPEVLKCIPHCPKYNENSPRIPIR